MPYLLFSSFILLLTDEVNSGLDLGVLSMKQKEKAQFLFEPEYYCGKFDPRVPKDTPVLFQTIVSKINISFLNYYLKLLKS